ncbi:MAG: hypothetical protein K6E68_08620, partial [Lachnospiraceae bacterium]|nr:hypothetical protein [Lachnospiraceae bacterium]
RGVELNDPNCMLYLGAMYCTGEGVEVDFMKATELLNRIKEITGEDSDYYKMADEEIKKMISVVDEALNKK